MAYIPGQGFQPQHSVSYSHIITMAGLPVGSITNLTMSQTRTTERIREINSNWGPQVKEIIWGGTDVNLQLTHVELYTENIFKAIGATLIYSLDEVNFVFNIVEIQHTPASVPNGAQRGSGAFTATRYITYEDCVPSDIGKTIDIDGAVKIIETMTVQVTRVSVN